MAATYNIKMTNLEVDTNNHNQLKGQYILTDSSNASSSSGVAKNFTMQSKPINDINLQNLKVYFEQPDFELILTDAAEIPKDGKVTINNLELFFNGNKNGSIIDTPKTFNVSSPNNDNNRRLTPEPLAASPAAAVSQSQPVEGDIERVVAKYNAAEAAKNANQVAKDNVSKILTKAAKAAEPAEPAEPAAAAEEKKEEQSQEANGGRRSRKTRKTRKQRRRRSKKSRRYKKN